ncbi:tetratricopeptide repeat protein [Aquimarina spongiae]|uniref:Tetratricopeptide repeat-containing protein n=1 Tax=Aquimarina spongiae TaxID=570521 RepID=A0A1M6E5H0_9FLAO|nr:hypothetical protein [Aquimarina spongiae]SHI80643.1 hypothetical protein SAMN04488508_103223 [Aquimarina spongiae]
MNDKIHQLLGPNLSKDEEDKILGQILKEKHDADLKVKWKTKLENEYGITRNKHISKNKNRNTFIKILLATAACIAVVVTIQLAGSSAVDVSLIAQNYLDEQEILHPGTSKGVSKEEVFRTLAIQSFNQKEYKQSSGYYQSLTNPDQEDLYYHGLALLLSKDYENALQKFEENKQTGDKYAQEINWYQSLTFLLLKQIDAAEDQLEQINPDDWNYEKAQKLLEQLKNQ